MDSPLSTATFAAMSEQREGRYSIAAVLWLRASRLALTRAGKHYMLKCARRCEELAANASAHPRRGPYPRPCPAAMVFSSQHVLLVIRLFAQNGRRGFSGAPASVYAASPRATHECARAKRRCGRSPSRKRRRRATATPSWLLRTAHNLIVDFYRTRRNEVPLEETEAVAEEETEAVAEAIPSLRSLEPCIAPLAAKLPEGYRSALLRDLDGIAQQEIARRQSVSLSGAKSRIQRARALLQREFERCCRYHFDADGALLAYTPRARVNACE